MELDNIDAAKKMVQEGFGVALIPYTAVADELDAGLLRRVEIEDAAAADGARSSPSAAAT